MKDMPRVTYSSMDSFLAKFEPLYATLLQIADSNSYVVIEISGTTLANFKVAWRETLNRLATYPHWETYPPVMGRDRAHQLLSWWKRHQLGDQPNEANCLLLRPRGTPVPRHQYHIRYDFYDGIIGDTLSVNTPTVEAQSLTSPSFSDHHAPRNSAAVTRPYEEDEFRAWFLLKSRNCIAYQVILTGITLDKLPPISHPNVPIIDPDDGTQSIILL